MHAVSKGASVLVFRLEQVVPPSDLDFVLSISQWLDALPPPVEAHLDRLVGAVESLLDVRTGRRTNRPAAFPELPDDVVAELMRTEDVRFIYGSLVDDDPDLVRTEIIQMWRNLHVIPDYSPKATSEKEPKMAKFRELLEQEARLPRGGPGMFKDVAALKAALMQRAALTTAVEQALVAGTITQREHDDLILLNRLMSMPPSTILQSCSPASWTSRR